MFIWLVWFWSGLRFLLFLIKPTTPSSHRRGIWIPSPYYDRAVSETCARQDRVQKVLPRIIGIC